MTFEDTLAAWLPAQRWYSGSATVRELSITADTTLAEGRPDLRPQTVGVSSGGQTARSQVLVGTRRRLPDSLRHAVIGPADSGGTAYEALHDPELTKILLPAMADQATIGQFGF